MSPQDPQTRSECEEVNNQPGPDVVYLAGSPPPERTKPRRLHLHFHTRPVRILGSGRVEAVELEIGQPGQGGGRTVRTETVKAGLVLRAIGYRCHLIEGLPIDEVTGTVPNRAARVVDGEAAIERLYVAGWMKRGPSGVIGTNRSDALETVKSLLEDLDTSPPPGRIGDDLVEILRRRGARPTSWEAWLRLDAEEVRRGSRRHAARVKLGDPAAELEICGTQPGQGKRPSGSPRCHEPEGVLSRP